MDKYIGKRLDGRYEIQEIIGVGGMAVVYKAYDRQENRTVSVKILRDEFAGNEEFMRRFRNESRAVSMLSHPNIVKIYDMSFGDRFQYIVMEYIDGITLKEYIDQQKVIRWKEAVHFTLQILYALQHAHERGVIHRDIKPQNIMLLRDGTIKVTDFGIARFSSSETQTLTDKAIGSVHYIAPEQARGSVTDAKSDVYSVGVMLYEMLTGKLPFEAENAVSVAIMQMQAEAVPPREINPDIPEGLEQITLKAMKKDPTQRYDSAASMIADINAFKQNPSIRFQYEYFIDENPTRAINLGRSTDVDPTENVVDLDRQRKKISLIPVLSGILAALVLFGLAFGVIAFLRNLPKSNEKKEIFLPDFVGQTYESVQTQYGDQFEFVVQYEPDQSLDPGTIKKQEPKGGVKNVVLGSKVTLTVSSGLEYVKVPSGLAGQPLSEVKAILSENQLSSTLQEVYDKNTASGSVVTVYPAEGSEVPVGTKITIYVSKGKEDTSVVVENYVGMTFNDAKNAILKKNLKVSEPIVEDSDRPKDEVIRQDPDYGTKLEEGDSVVLTVSSGKPPQPVEVTGKFDVHLPTTANAALDFTVWIDGVQDTSQTKRVDPALTGTVTVQVTGLENTTVSVMIRLNGVDYQNWQIDFSTGQARLVRDYGFVVPTSSVAPPPSSQTPPSSQAEPPAESSASSESE